MKLDEESLTTLLTTPALRAELALLVALCTDKIRRNVLANFPEPARLDAPASQITSPPLALLDGDLINFNEEETIGWT